LAYILLCPKIALDMVVFTPGNYHASFEVAPVIHQRMTEKSYAAMPNSGNADSQVLYHFRLILKAVTRSNDIGCLSARNALALRG